MTDGYDVGFIRLRRWWYRTLRVHADGLRGGRFDDAVEFGAGGQDALDDGGSSDRPPQSPEHWLPLAARPATTTSPHRSSTTRLAISSPTPKPSRATPKTLLDRRSSPPPARRQCLNRPPPPPRQINPKTTRL